jgi:hypothetical protein
VSDQAQRFRLELVALPASTPAVVRVRALLKHALRVLRLRAVDAKEAPDLQAEVQRLQGIVDGLTARVAAQAELLEGRAGKEGATS